MQATLHQSHPPVSLFTVVTVDHHTNRIDSEDLVRRHDGIWIAILICRLLFGLLNPGDRL